MTSYFRGNFNFSSGTATTATITAATMPAATITKINSPFFILTSSAIVVVGHAVPTNFTFDTVQSSNYLTIVAPTTTVTMTAAYSGTWRLIASCIFASGASGERLISIMVNGIEVSSDRRVTNTTGNDSRMCVSCDIAISAGQTIQMRVYHTQGGNLNVGGQPYTRLSGLRISD